MRALPSVVPCRTMFRRRAELLIVSPAEKPLLRKPSHPEGDHFTSSIWRKPAARTIGRQVAAPFAHQPTLSHAPIHAALRSDALIFPPRSLRGRFPPRVLGAVSGSLQLQFDFGRTGLTIEMIAAILLETGDGSPLSPNDRFAFRPRFDRQLQG